VKNDSIFRKTTSQGVPIQFQKAPKFKASRKKPGKYSVGYSHSLLQKTNLWKKNILQNYVHVFLFSTVHPMKTWFQRQNLPKNCGERPKMFSGIIY
jgi:hypothetical protein